MEMLQAGHSEPRTENNRNLVQRLRVRSSREVEVTQAFYSFVLEDNADRRRIDLNSDIESHLYLLVAGSDDYTVVGGPTLAHDSLFWVEDMPRGTYYIEAVTSDEGVSGDFTLGIFISRFDISDFPALSASPQKPIDSVPLRWRFRSLLDIRSFCVRCCGCRCRWHRRSPIRRKAR